MYMIIFIKVFSYEVIQLRSTVWVGGGGEGTVTLFFPGLQYTHVHTCSYLVICNTDSSALYRPTNITKVVEVSLTRRLTLIKMFLRSFKPDEGMNRKVE